MTITKISPRPPPEEKKTDKSMGDALLPFPLTALTARLRLGRRVSTISLPCRSARNRRREIDARTENGGAAGDTPQVRAV